MPKKNWNSVTIIVPKDAKNQLPIKEQIHTVGLKYKDALGTYDDRERSQANNSPTPDNYAQALGKNLVPHPILEKHKVTPTSVRIPLFKNGKGVFDITVKSAFILDVLSTITSLFYQDPKNKKDNSSNSNSENTGISNSNSENTGILKRIFSKFKSKKDNSSNSNSENTDISNSNSENTGISKRILSWVAKKLFRKAAEKRHYIWYFLSFGLVAFGVAYSLLTNAISALNTGTSLGSIIMIIGMGIFIATFLSVKYKELTLDANRKAQTDVTEEKIFNIFSLPLIIHKINSNQSGGKDNSEGLEIATNITYKDLCKLPGVLKEINKVTKLLDQALGQKDTGKKTEYQNHKIVEKINSAKEALKTNYSIDIDKIAKGSEIYSYYQNLSKERSTRNAKRFLSLIAIAGTTFAMIHFGVGAITIFFLLLSLFYSRLMFNNNIAYNRSLLKETILEEHGYDVFLNKIGAINQLNENKIEENKNQNKQDLNKTFYFEESKDGPAILCNQAITLEITEDSSKFMEIYNEYDIPKETLEAILRTRKEAKKTEKECDEKPGKYITRITEAENRFLVYLFQNGDHKLATAIRSIYGENCLSEFARNARLTLSNEVDKIQNSEVREKELKEMPEVYKEAFNAAENKEEVMKFRKTFEKLITELSKEKDGNKAEALYIKASEVVANFDQVPQIMRSAALSKITLIFEKMKAEPNKTPKAGILQRLKSKSNRTPAVTQAAGSAVKSDDMATKGQHLPRQKEDKEYGEVLIYNTNLTPKY